jgi:pimeloyl-[acyl-carrier protein] methyl ester esterase
MSGYQLPGLYTQVEGEGPDLVLVHGWGLHAGIWDGLAPILAASWRVTRVDLPGHGRSRGAPVGTSMRDWARQVTAVVPDRAMWLGWSLGGMVAMQAALEFPHRVAGLVGVAVTPKFVRDTDWPLGVEPTVLAQFAEQLRQDYRTTVLDFLALQARGSEHARAEIRHLRGRVFAHGEPDPLGLSVGLKLLRDVDLRGELANLRCPILGLFGQRDRLVPSALIGPLSSLLPKATLGVIKGAGHAPFISHRQEFLAALKTFFDIC